MKDPAAFDSLCFALFSEPAQSQTRLTPAESRARLAELLRLDALGLLAIACGSLQRARELAWRYARERRQGGRTIVEHPAVSLMLADIDLAQQAAVDWLESAARAPAAFDLGRVFAARARLHPQLCQAADQAIQVHGGNGYMRDYGLEKVWREQQCLRRLGGTSLELKLFVSRWVRSA